MFINFIYKIICTKSQKIGHCHARSM